MSIIVSITALMEGNKKKADKYWPDEENRIMDLGNGVKLEYKETSYQGTYYLRWLIINTSLLTYLLILELSLSTHWMVAQ